MRRMILVFLALAMVAASGALAFAPYLPRMFQEGSPSLGWTGRGSYADVDGAHRPVVLGEPASVRPMNAALRGLIEGRGGAALLAAHRGDLVLEHYAAGNSPETRYNSFSMVKSLVGALVFKALADGRLAGLDQTLGELLPEAPGLSGLTLRRLITMRAGIRFDTRTASFGEPSGSKDSDTSPNPFGPLARLHYEGLHAVQAGLTMDENPADAFAYQNVNTALLGAVLERAYAMPLERLLSEHIWMPAGAAAAAWRRPQPDAAVSAYCCLYATARDWIRVGIFLMRNGRPGDPFLPDALWREWLGLDIDGQQRSAGHYGNHARQDVLDRPGQALQGPFTYFVGQDGQILYLMPDEDLVVYRAGNGIQLLHSTLYEVWNSIAE